MTAFADSMDDDQTAVNDKFILGLYCLLVLAVFLIRGYNSFSCLIHTHSLVEKALEYIIF